MDIFFSWRDNLQILFHFMLNRDCLCMHENTRDLSNKKNP
jgi:hypothetical protein